MALRFFAALISVLVLILPLKGSYAFGGKAASSQSSSSQSAGDAASSSSAETVWVSRSDGSQMCSTDSGQSLEQGSASLKQAHINVISSQKGSDAKMHAQMCGLPTGHVNAYEINKSDLGKANVLGYQQIK